MQDHPLDPLDREGFLERPGRLVVEKLLLLRLPLDDAHQVRIFHRGHVHQFLRQLGVGQQQRHRVAREFGVFYGFRDQTGKIRLHARRNLRRPSLPHHPAMHVRRDKLRVQPADAERGHPFGNLVSVDFPGKHVSWSVLILAYGLFASSRPHRRHPGLSHKRLYR